MWGIGNTRPNLHFFQYTAYKPFAEPVPPNTKQYQLIQTKYQPVSSCTDPVPSSITYNSSSRKAQFSQLNNFSTTNLMSHAQYTWSSFKVNLFSQISSMWAIFLFRLCIPSGANASALLAENYNLFANQVRSHHHHGHQGQHHHHPGAQYDNQHFQMDRLTNSSNVMSNLTTNVTAVSSAEQYFRVGVLKVWQR